MELILVGLATVAQAVAAPPSTPRATIATVCAALDRRQNLNAEDLHNLATCLFRGEGMSRDLNRARTLYRQAADRGYVRAQCALGNMMIEGTGGAQDIAGGLALCRRAAEAGEAQAQTDFGNYLLTGRVMPKDAVEARRWYLLAAQQGQANAAFVLGQIYWNGDGVAKDYAEAARWWRVAHERGRPDAAYLLAREASVRSLSRGQENIDAAAVEEAIRWFEFAARTDPSPADRQDATDKLGLFQRLLTLVRQRQGQ